VRGDCIVITISYAQEQESTQAEKEAEVTRITDIG